MFEQYNNIVVGISLLCMLCANPLYSYVVLLVMCIYFTGGVTPTKCYVAQNVKQKKKKN